MTAPIDIIEQVELARKWMDSEDISQRRINTKRSTIALENVLAIYASHVTASLQRGQSNVDLEAQVASLTKERDELQKQAHESLKWVMRDAFNKHELGLSTRGDGKFYNKRAEEAEARVESLTQENAKLDERAGTWKFAAEKTGERVESLEKALRQLSEGGWLVQDVREIARKALQEGK